MTWFTSPLPLYASPSPLYAQLKPHAASAIAEYTRNPAFYQVGYLRRSNRFVPHICTDHIGLCLSHIFSLASISGIVIVSSPPDRIQSDLGELPAVKQLAADPQYAPLYKLMTSMLSGDIAGEEKRELQFRLICLCTQSEVLEV